MNGRGLQIVATAGEKVRHIARRSQARRPLGRVRAARVHRRVIGAIDRPGGGCDARIDQHCGERWKRGRRLELIPSPGSEDRPMGEAGGGVGTEFGGDEAAAMTLATRLAALHPRWWVRSCQIGQV